MGAPSKRATRIRKSQDFDVKKISYLPTPKRNSSVFSWSLASIFSAREQQMIGHFYSAARLAESMRTDDALFVAYQNRLAPQQALSVRLTAAKGARGRPIAAEAEALYGEDGVGLTKSTSTDIHGCLVNHGVAFAVNDATVREDGSRVDLAVRYWPIEYVRWDTQLQSFVTRLDDGSEQVITHGDGRWTVFCKSEYEPWKCDAAIIPGALVWARHAYALRDWSKASTVHGNVKIVGEMPEGVPLQGSEGGLSEEANAFLALLQALASEESPLGIRPAGAKTEIISNPSNAWQVWLELVANAEKAAARIYLGTDGTLGTQGGAPGVDIQSLFGVATTRVQGDLEALEKGIRTGVLEPWCAMNFGDSALAPHRVYVLPDPDAQSERQSFGERMLMFTRDVQAFRENGLIVDQETVNALAARYGVMAPRVKVAAPVTPNVA